MSPTECLSMLDENGARKTLIPAEVHGRYRKWRDLTYFVLLLILVLLPWTKMNGMQTLLFDIPGRRFQIFGWLFLAHDAPLLFFLASTFVLLLAFITSVWGRVWCGWACPQTVFIEAVYRRIEIWIEGTYIERRRLRESPWTVRKFRLWLTKWLLYVVVSSLFAHSFIAYFSGSERLLEMLRGSPSENWIYFLLVSFVTAGLLFLFAWFREQFCIIMCPYGRFQGLMIDSKTKTIYYDKTRGEPRKGLALPAGDCVACNRCVQVCPTGIDIRNGIQMECIGCTACIDACDEIMVKVKKTVGLISYRQEVPTRRAYLRTRSLTYATLALISISGWLYSLGTRTPYSLILLRAKDAPYQEMSDGLIMNHFKAHFLNQTQSAQNFEITLSEAETRRGIKITQSARGNPLASGQAAEVHFFLSVPKGLFNEHGETHLKVLIFEAGQGLTQEYEVPVIGPYSSSAGS